MGTETKKLLLIGATGYDQAKEGLRLDCVNWDKLSEVQNVRDYDVLVLNLLPIGTQHLREKVDWVKFNELLNFSAASDILTHEGRIVILGDPRFKIPDSNRFGGNEFLNWTGAFFVWDNQPGDTIKFPDSESYQEFKEYLGHLRKWNYSLKSCGLNRPVCAESWDFDFFSSQQFSVSLQRAAACVNRYDHPLAFYIHHQIVDRYGHTQIPYGRIYLLPQVSLDEDETLQIVLRDFCDAASELPEPEWVSGFNVPGQKAIDIRIAQTKAVLADQQAALRKAMAERLRVRRCLKLLYEREYALEPVVRDILCQLGAMVDHPLEKNKEDGWIKVEVAGKTYEGVLEIKSTKSDQFNEDGRRQLLDWIERGRTIRGKNYKGIFIGNSAVTKPVKDRPDAFSDSWKKAAQLSHICAIKSEELFRILILYQQAKVNLADFWTRLFTTDGIFDIKPFLPIKPNQATSPA